MFAFLDLARLITAPHYHWHCVQAPRTSTRKGGLGGGRADAHMLLLKTLSNEGAAALSLRVVDDLRARSDGDLPAVAYDHLTTAFVVQGDLDQAERTMRMRPTSWWGVTRETCVLLLRNSFPSCELSSGPCSLSHLILHKTITSTFFWPLKPSADHATLANLVLFAE